MNKITKFILLVLGSLLFCFTATKAYLLSVTWDEAYSYTEYVRRGITFPTKFESMSANNHLLLTWMDVVLVKIFGLSEIVLRLPALMAHLIFLFFSAKLLSHFQNRWLIISGFLIINLNPYLLDFFSLARGYGLSIGLMMASIYYLYIFQNEFKRKQALFSMLFGALSVLANYVLLNYFLGLFAGILVLILLRVVHSRNADTQKISFWKSSWPLITIFLLLLIGLLPIALGLRAAGALYFGAENGFWVDTVRTIVDRWFYELNYNYWILRLAKGGIIAVLSGAVILIALQLKERWFTLNNSFLVTITGICFFCVTSTIAQHYLFHTLYLIDRTALFFTVLFPIILVFFIEELAKKKSKTAFLSYLAAIFVTIHTIRAINFKYVLEWKWDANTKEMLADLEKLKKVSPEKGNISLSIPLLFESDINFYRGMNHLNWLNIVARSKRRELFDDYYYLSPKELSQIHPDSIEILKTYPVTNNVLVEPKFKWKNPRVCVQQELRFEKEVGQQYYIDSAMEFSKTITYIVPDSVAMSKHSAVVFEAVVKPTPDDRSGVKMVITLENPEGSYLWAGVSLMDYTDGPDKWVKAVLTTSVPESVKAGDKLLIYFWNPEHQEVYVKEMRFKWLKYD